MHDLLIAAAFVAFVLTPCVAASLVRPATDEENL
jgi:hypothetical protein